MPVITLSGVISATSSFRPSLSIGGLEATFDRAFGMKSAPAVAIVVNSPGGSAAQSHLIFRRIRRLAEEKGKTVIVAVEDVAASGGYFIALAGDEIIVDPSSIVGSIGVVSAGFGFSGLLEKIGVERRVHTAGENKVMLDPFRPEREADVARLMALQRDVHTTFIDLVKARRGARLVDDPEPDRVGDLGAVLRERYGEKVRLLPIDAGRTFLRRRLGLAARADPAAALLDRAIAAIEARMLWHRFGL